jgi:hypothetical protein
MLKMVGLKASSDRLIQRQASARFGPSRNVRAEKKARKRMNPLAAIWFVFALIFSGLGVYHFGAASASISQFNIEDMQYRKGSVELEKPSTGVDIETRLRKFYVDLNKYITTYNKSTRQQNVIAGIGYIVAAVTAIFAMVIELRDFLS